MRICRRWEIFFHLILMSFFCNWFASIGAFSSISTDLLLSLTIFSSKRSKRGGQFHIICKKVSFLPILLGFLTIWFFMNNVTNVTPVLRIIGVKIDPVILLCPPHYCVRILCLGKVACLPVDCCFRELAR